MPISLSAIRLQIIYVSVLREKIKTPSREIDVYKKLFHWEKSNS